MEATISLPPDGSGTQTFVTPNPQHGPKALKRCSVCGAAADELFWPIVPGAYCQTCRGIKIQEHAEKLAKLWKEYWPDD